MKDLKDFGIQELNKNQLRHVDGGGFLAFILGALTALSEGPAYHHYSNGTTTRLTTMSM